MNLQYVTYAGLLVLCLTVAGVTLALYYTQDFSESLSFKQQLRLADVVFEAYDQSDYDSSYNCRYNDSNEYVCDSQGKGTTRVLQYATAVIGTLTLSNDGVFTQMYEPPRLLGCIEFVSVEASNGLRFPRELTFDYQKEGTALGTEGYDMYGYKGYDAYGYGYSGDDIGSEIRPGKKESYNIVVHYRPYSIPLADFTKGNIKEISIYEIPARRDNPLADDYQYDSFTRNPTCEYAEQNNLEPLARITIS